MKKNRLYNIINTVGLGICILFIIVVFAFEDQKVLFGVLLRGAFGLLMMYNGFYLLFTKGASFLVKNSTVNNRRILGLLLLLTGVIGFVTAVIGHGLNGYPVLDWGTIF